MREAIREASDKGGKITCNTSVVEEVDALMSRWKAVKTTSDQWTQKMAQLAASWRDLDSSYGDLSKWLEDKEKIVESPLDTKSLDGALLNKNLDAVKELNNEITQKQAKLLDLAKECDLVAPNLTQESAGDLRAKVSGLRDRAVQAVR